MARCLNLRVYYHKFNLSAYKADITEVNKNLYPNNTQFNQGDFESNRIKSYDGFCQAEKLHLAAQKKRVIISVHTYHRNIGRM